jgi:4-hydroxy-4-methyl-2-oxoglutarate aldolase
MDARIQANYPELPPFVGFAATATFRGSGPPLQGTRTASLQEQVERFDELSGPPVLVLQDLDDPSVAATFGEIMCTTYQKFGSVGLITSGGGRDLDQVEALGFQVFTSCTICAHGYVHIPQVYVPVHVGGMLIYPDDLLHGDRNGVTTIPREIASEVADAADEYMAAEASILEVLGRGDVTFRELAQARAELSSRISALRSRLRRAGSEGPEAEGSKNY